MNQLLDILAEGKTWHGIDEIAERIGIPRSETREIIDFLAAHNFIQMDKNWERARISKRIEKFLAEISKEEEP
jgi:DNA-binding IclR family transcriptional regulator